MSVLLVEDDPNTQSMFQMIMEHHNIELVIADNANSAMDAFNQHRPDAIIMDIFLPDTDGYKLMELMRSTSKETPPIVAITAYYTTDTLSDMQQAGFDGYMLKPLDPFEVMPYLAQVAHIS